MPTASCFSGLSTLIPLGFGTGFETRSIARKLKLVHSIAAPAGMIGASNIFELAVAVAIALFGPSLPVAFATIVGVLVEVPVMLTLVKITNRRTHWFPEEGPLKVK